MRTTGAKTRSQTTDSAEPRQKAIGIVNLIPQGE
jgi:hypothetical protein